MGTIEDAIGTNFDFVIECLGPADSTSIAQDIDRIESLGGHYVSVPPIPGQFPFYTDGWTVRKEIEDRYNRIIQEVGGIY